MTRGHAEKELRRHIESMGWKVTLTKRRHMKCFKPGCPMVIVGYSTEPRSIRNALALLRQAEKQLSDTYGK